MANVRMANTHHNPKEGHMDHNELERAVRDEDATPPLNTPHVTFTEEEATVRKHFNDHMLYLADYAKKMAEWFSDDDYDYFDGTLTLAGALLSATYDGDMDQLVRTVNEGGPPWDESTTPQVCKWLYSLPGVTVS